MSDYRPGAPPTYAPDDRSPAQIEADLAATRQRLASTVDTIVDSLHPRNLAHRLGEAVASPFVDGQGRPDARKIAPVAGGAVAAVALLVGLRLLVRRR